jgi:hypothetical protein
VAEVELGRAGQALVDAGQFLSGKAEAPVFNLDSESAAHLVGPDHHPGGGRRERRGVLDQFGEQVDNVVDRVADHGVR